MGDSLRNSSGFPNADTHSGLVWRLNAPQSMAEDVNNFETTFDTELVSILRQSVASPRTPGIYFGMAQVFKGLQVAIV